MGNEIIEGHEVPKLLLEFITVTYEKTGQPVNIIEVTEFGERGLGIPEHWIYIGLDELIGTKIIESPKMGLYIPTSENPSARVPDDDLTQWIYSEVFKLGYDARWKQFVHVTDFDHAERRKYGVSDEKFRQRMLKLWKAGIIDLQSHNTPHRLTLQEKLDSVTVKSSKQNEQVPWDWKGGDVDFKTFLLWRKLRPDGSPMRIDEIQQNPPNDSDWMTARLLEVVNQLDAILDSTRYALVFDNNDEFWIVDKQTWRAIWRSEDYIPDNTAEEWNRLTRDNITPEEIVQAHEQQRGDRFQWPQEAFEEFWSKPRTNPAGRTFTKPPIWVTLGRVAEITYLDTNGDEQKYTWGSKYPKFYSSPNGLLSLIDHRTGARLIQNPTHTVEDPRFRKAKALYEDFNMKDARKVQGGEFHWPGRGEKWEFQGKITQWVYESDKEGTAGQLYVHDLSEPYPKFYTTPNKRTTLIDLQTGSMRYRDGWMREPNE